MNIIVELTQSTGRAVTNICIYLRIYHSTGNLPVRISCYRASDLWFCVVCHHISHQALEDMNEQIEFLVRYVVYGNV